jgi:hypothetical protein
MRSLVLILLLCLTAVPALAMDYGQIAQMGFSQLDTDGNGSLTLSELESFLPGSDAEETLAEADSDKSGDIDTGEWDAFKAADGGDQAKDAKDVKKGFGGFNLN